MEYWSVVAAPIHHHREMMMSRIGWVWRESTNQADPVPSAQRAEHTIRRPNRENLWAGPDPLPEVWNLL